MLNRLIFLTLAIICVVQCDWIKKDLDVARVRPAVAQVGSKIYIAGGQIAPGIETTSIEVLNTETFEFEGVDLNLPSPRQQLSAVPIGNKIYFSGGLATESNLVIFNETSAAFNRLAKAPWIRNVQHIQFLNSSALCVFGDNSLDIYNAATQTWTTIEEYRAVVKQLFKFGFGVANNVAYVVGGVFPSNGTLSSNVWTFDLLSHKLTCHNNSILPQYFPDGLKLSSSANGLIMTGGFNGSDFNQMVNVFNLTNQKWLSLTCNDLNPALNAVALGAITNTTAYIVVDAKTAGLDAKIKTINLVDFQVTLTTLPLMTGAWTSLITAGDKVIVCGKGAVLNTFYILDDITTLASATVLGALPDFSFELSGKFVLVSSLGDIYQFDPLATILGLVGLEAPSQVVVAAKVVDSKLVVTYTNGDVTTVSANGAATTTNIDEDILGIFGDHIITTDNTYLASTLAQVKAVTGDAIPTGADIVGLFDTLPNVCTVMNILEDVVTRASQRIDVYDTVANSWAVITVNALADKTLAFAGTVDDCLIFTASNIAYIVNTTESKVTQQFILDESKAIDAVRAFVQAPLYNDTLFVGVGSSIAEVTLTSSDLTVRSDAPHVINHMVLLDETIFVADVESTKLYFYSLVNNTWSTVALGRKLVNYAIAAVNGTVLLVGGNDGTTSALGGVSTDFDALLLFHPQNGTLTTLNVDINARSEVTPFSSSDAAVFIGGQNSYGEHQSTVDIYSARTSSQTTQPNTNTNPDSNPNNNNVPKATSASTLLMANVALVFAAIASLL